MPKLKEYKYIILICLVILGFAFYWFQIRPAYARHQCAWYDNHQDAVPAKPAQGTPLTQTQIDANNKVISDCDKYTSAAAMLWAPSYCSPTTDAKGYTVLGVQLPYPDTYVPAQAYKPATDWWGQATDDQYEFCLRNKGL